jgi:hypothetical protein
MSRVRAQQPTPPFLAQAQPKPGKESEMDPRPRYQAPLYRGSGKLQGQAARRRWPISARRRP